MRQTRDEILTAAYPAFTAGTSADTLINKLTERIESAVKLTDPTFVDLLVQGADRQRDERFKVDEIDVLAPDARARILDAARAKWRQEQREHHASAEAAVALLTAETEGRLAKQRILTGEGDQPAESRTERLLAQLLDTHAEKAASDWIDDHTPEQALARYTAATDDGTERAFVRTFERLHEAKVLDLSASKDPLGAARTFRETIAARKDARRSPRDLALVETLGKMRVDLDRSAVGPSNAARILRSAGKEGTQPRPARVTTPGTDDGRATVN